MCFLKLSFLSKQPRSPPDADADATHSGKLPPSGRKRPASHAYATSSSSQSSDQLSRVSRDSTTSSAASTSLVEGAKQMASDGGAMVFRFKDLNRATDRFSSDSRLGVSGSVYRAWLQGKEVTVTHKAYEGGPDMDFREQLKMLCSVHHANIVRVLGGCFVGGDRVYLVHDFCRGANLRDALRSPINPRFTLLPSWTSRLQVAVDVAKALEYLHQYASPTHIHKYVKSSNIIIDSDLRAKVAQFGVSWMIGDLESANADTSVSISSGEIQQHEAGDSSSRRSTSSSKQRSIRITGTRGYMPPEYLSSGLVTVKYDVYAFGVVLLELLSGQEPVGIVQGAQPNVYNYVSITASIAAILEDDEADAKRRKLRRWMDPLLQETYHLDNALKAALLAKACVDPNPGFRPLMPHVAVQLSKLLTGATTREASMAAAKNLMSGPVEAR